MKGKHCLEYLCDMHWQEQQEKKQEKTRKT